MFFPGKIPLMIDSKSSGLWSVDESFLNPRKTSFLPFLLLIRSKTDKPE